MATTMKVGDATYYQGKAGTIVDLPMLLGEHGREQGVVMRYPLPADEAADRPKVSLVIGANGKPTGEKIEEPWPDGEIRFAKTTCSAADLRWDTGRKAWIVAGHGLKTKAGAYYPDASHPENVHPDKKEG